MTQLIDCAVAVHLMGWGDHGDGLFWDDQAKRMRLIVGSKIWECRQRMKIYEDAPDRDFIFSPSTIMDHTLIVIDKMTAKGWLWDAHGSKNEVEMSFSHIEHGVGKFLSPNFKFAICIAALSALNVRVVAQPESTN